ncbi:toxin-antitoxin system TumE family protein [Halovivax cerinus]|uniref:DUF6516 family protein n=1 Tax=Halovivax cerinus TaxID=1487865 RepID=A0ABD5NRQ5_9EURY|nr:DUF6516 family protein [Halovivax cerinus]
MPATKRFEAGDEFPAGDRWEALAWDVPRSDAFPEGLKYSFQYLGPADDAILRYDNANDAHGVGRHHRHYRGTVEGIEFEGLRSHVRTFLDEVETIHDREFA